MTWLITAPADSAASSRRASTNAGSNACVTPQPRHRTRGTKIFRSRSCQRTCRQYPDQNTTGTRHDGQSRRGTCTARPIDAYASTVSGHGHTIDMANHRPRSLLAQDG